MPVQSCASLSFEALYIRLFDIVTSDIDQSASEKFSRRGNNVWPLHSIDHAMGLCWSIGCCSRHIDTLHLQVTYASQNALIVGAGGRSPVV